MIAIELSLAWLAIGLPVALLAIGAACCLLTPPAVALPRPRGEWYPPTLPPAPEPATRPFPAAAVPCLQESWVQQVMAQLEQEASA